MGDASRFARRSNPTVIGFGGSEFFLEHLGAELEDAFELGFDEEGVDYFAYDSEGEEIVDLVLHEDAVFCLGEGVAMMPDFVWAGALVIDEV